MPRQAPGLRRAAGTHGGKRRAYADTRRRAIAGRLEVCHAQDHGRSGLENFSKQESEVAYRQRILHEPLLTLTIKDKLMKTRIMIMALVAALAGNNTYGLDQLWYDLRATVPTGK